MALQNIGPLSNVTPFTYRDGETYLSLLRRLRIYVDNLSTLVDKGLIDVANVAIEAANAAIDAANSLAEMVAVNDVAIRAVLDGPINNLTNAALATRIPWKRPKNFDVVGDGITDDSTNLQNCLNAGSTLFDATTYYVNDTLTFPVQFDQLGLGPSSTKFKLGPQGKIIIGSQSEPASAFLGGSPNGTTSGFSIDGNGVAPQGLITGNYGGRTHRDIVIYSCTSNPLLVDSTQNSTFEGLKIGGGDVGIILDHGAGGNHFSKCEIYDYGQHGIDFRNTGTLVGIQDIGYSYPQHIGCCDNTFISTLIELGKATALAPINHRAGSFNTFIRCAAETAGQGVSADTSAVLIGQLNTAITVGLRFDMCHFLGLDGANARASVFNANSGAASYSRTYVTNCIASGFNNIFVGHDNDYFTRSGNEFVTENDGFEWVPQAGSNAKFWHVLRGSQPTDFYEIGVLGEDWAATADVSIRARRVNDSIELQGQAKCLLGVPDVAGDVVVTGLPTPNGGTRNAHFLIGQGADNTTDTGHAFYVVIDVTGSATLATLKNLVPPNTIVHFDGVTYPYIDA